MQAAGIILILEVAKVGRPKLHDALYDCHISPLDVCRGALKSVKRKLKGRT